MINFQLEEITRNIKSQLVEIGSNETAVAKNRQNKFVENKALKGKISEAFN